MAAGEAVGAAGDVPPEKGEEVERDEALEASEEFEADEEVERDEALKASEEFEADEEVEADEDVESGEARGEPRASWGEGSGAASG